MQQKVKRRTFAGRVLEQEVYTVAANRKDISRAEPLERFESEEERARHRDEISRRRQERIINENFGPQSLYSTLTIDNDHEVHTFEDAGRLADLYIRRLRYANPDAQIMLYMGRGKSTSRIHFHMLSNGLSKETIRGKWKAGDIDRIETLRKHNYDKARGYIGRDYAGIANYLSGHWTPEQGGHRYKATKNLRRPKPEEPKPIKRAYSESKPPRAPEGYKLIDYKSTKYGYQYFKYVRIDEADERPPHMRR